MKILIVDDEPLVRKSLGRAFRAKGHDVTEAVDGLDGLDQWLKTKPDVVFVDVLMPGLSGPELLAEVGRRGRGELKSARVILMSAFSGQQNLATAHETIALQTGADLFVPKPFDDVFALVSKAEELFGGSKGSS